MKFRHLICTAGILVLSHVGYSQGINQDLCFQQLKQAETKPDPVIYTQCGFNDQKIAIDTWLPVARENNLAHALYEICVRHPKYPNSQQFCAEAAKLGDGAAVAWGGDRYYEKNDIPKAMSYYNYAIQRGGLSLENEGKILEKLAFLYVDPKSHYYNKDEAIPLLQKASKQRSAKSNNLLGYLTFYGKDGIKQNTKEAFLYFWRAMLLGCPAAEENLGFLQLVEKDQIKKDQVEEFISQRSLSCDASNQEQVVVDDLSINVYRLKFTPEECADINYYAEHLIDTSLPFTGKEECGFSDSMQQIRNFLRKQQSQANKN